MSETGWPLIPREVLPAPVPPAARGRRAPRAAQPEAGRQLSIFGAEAAEPSPLDLTGLVAGPGRLDRMGGTARVAVTVDSGWRVHVLVAELVSRGLVVHWRPLQTDPDVRPEQSPPEPGDNPPLGDDDVHPPLGDDDVHPPLGDDDVPAPPGGDDSPPPAGGDDAHPAPEAGSDDVPPVRPGPPAVVFEVRTAYSSRLNGLAHTWPAAAARLFLSGPRLRLWVAATGRPVDGGYALGLGTPDPVTWPAVAAALRRAGLDGALSEHGLDFLIMGRKRLARLAELVGERPEAASAELWPGGPAA